MASNRLDDATPVLAERFRAVQAQFESNLPSWGLRVDQTLRSDAEQLEAFLSGHSQIDPRNPAARLRAKHLAGPDGKSRALDVTIFSRSSGRSADKLLAIGALTAGSYDLLYLVLMLIVERNALRSGNDWNRNGIAVGPDAAEGFFDGGHMELSEAML